MKKHILGAALLFLLAAMPVQATAERLTPWLFLARVSINEAGWDSYESGDMAMIHEAFVRGAARQGVPYLAYATHYSQRVAGIRPSSSGRIAWTMNLRSDGQEPANWPRYVQRRLPNGTFFMSAHPSWSNFRDAWLATVAHAREVASWEIDDIDSWTRCNGVVHDWGSPSLDRARAERMGLSEVVCEAAPETQPVTLVVPDSANRRRLDRALPGMWSSQMPLGNATAARWIRIGRVTVDGELVTDGTFRVMAGQQVVVRPAPRNDSWSRPWLAPADSNDDQYQDVNEGASDDVDVD